MNDKPMERIIQESVPGKQVTIAHVIASPMADIYERLGIDEQGALGILTLTPCETAIIAADIATKAAEVEIGLQTALEAVTETLQSLLGFDTVAVTKT